MNKQEIEQKIASMERELAELKSKLVESDQSKIWQPKENEEFWKLIGDGTPVFEVNNSNITNDYIEHGNYFKTEEEAEKQAEYNRVMNRFRKYVEAYSEPLDWGNAYTDKWYLYYRYGEIRTRSSLINTPRDAFQIYASSAQILKDAIIYSAGSEEEFIRIVFGGNNVKN